MRTVRNSDLAWLLFQREIAPHYWFNIGFFEFGTKVVVFAERVMLLLVPESFSWPKLCREARV